MTTIEPTTATTRRTDLAGTPASEGTTVTTDGPPTAAMTSSTGIDPTSPVRKKRGRPKGSKNWPKDKPKPIKEPKKRGRPKGRKNGERDPNARPRKPKRKPEATNANAAPRTEEVKKMKHSQNARQASKAPAPEQSLTEQHPLPTDAPAFTYDPSRYRNIAPAIPPAPETEQGTMGTPYDMSSISPVDQLAPEMEQETIETPYYTTQNYGIYQMDQQAPNMSQDPIAPYDGPIAPFDDIDIAWPPEFQLPLEELTAAPCDEPLAPLDDIDIAWPPEFQLPLEESAPYYTNPSNTTGDLAWDEQFRKELEEAGYGLNPPPRVEYVPQLL